MSAHTPDPAVFRKAAEIIGSQGLMKGQYGHHGGRRCTVGALTQAAEVSCLVRLPETRFLAEMLGLPPVDTGAPIHFGIPAWSDRPDITAADVVTAFEQAAEKLEANR